MSTAITPALVISGRDLTEPKLDPSGRRLAFVARRGRAAAVVVVGLDAERAPERDVTTWPPPAPGRGLGGGCFAWLPDGSGIVYAAVDGGLWRQGLADGAPVCLVPAEEGRRADSPAVAPDGRFVAFVRAQAEVDAVPLAGGPVERLDDGAFAFCLDPAIAPDSSTVSYQAWSPPDMPWDGAAIVSVDVATGERTVRAAAGSAAQQPRYAPDGTLLVVSDATGWLNVHWGERPLIGAGEPFEHALPTWGPGQASYAVAPDGTRVALTRNERGFGRLVVVDVATGTVQDVARGVHGALSWRGRRLAAVRSGARTPTQVVVYEEPDWTRRVVAVGPALPWDHVELTEPQLITVAHDGTELHARLYRGRRAAGGRDPDRLLCWIHGGPTAQWAVEFNARIAYWVNHGWNVLVPDHRGSTGHGRAYQQAMRHRWGELDVADTAAILAHVQRAGVGRPATTVAMGGSSGGWTVLGLLTSEHAELLAGGVAAYPVTDLIELADRSHRFEAHYTDTLVAPRAQEDVLRERSMSGRADRVRRPLLLLHGTDDPVVPVEGTIVFADAARRAGADVELHVFDGEGHGFSDPTNQLREYELITDFLGRVVADGDGA